MLHLHLQRLPSHMAILGAISMTARCQLIVRGRLSYQDQAVYQKNSEQEYHRFLKVCLLGRYTQYAILTSETLHSNTSRYDLVVLHR